VPAKDPQLAQSYLLAKLLAVLLLEDLTKIFWLFPPEKLTNLQRPPSLWRIQQILLGALVFVVLGSLSVSELIRKASQLQRHLF